MVFGPDLALVSLLWAGKGLDVKMPTFPESMVKYRYFPIRNHCKIKNLSGGKFVPAIGPNMVFGPFWP